jgi:hypothetical protein
MTLNSTEAFESTPVSCADRDTYHAPCSLRHALMPPHFYEFNSMYPEKILKYAGSYAKPQKLVAIEHDRRIHLCVG